MSRPAFRPRTAVAVTAAAAVAVGLVSVATAGGSFDVVPRQTAGIVLWWVVLICAAFGLRTPNRPAAAGVIATAFGAVIAIWAAAGVGHSLSDERTVVEFSRALVHLAPIALVGWVMPRHLWRAVVIGAAAGATAVCFAALAERLSPGLIEDTRTVVFENTASRLATPLGYWNALGSWGVLTSLLLLGIASHVRQPGARAAALLPVPAVTAIIYLTYSRSAMAAGVFGLIVLIGLAKNRWTSAVQAVVVGVATGATVVVISGTPAIANATGGQGGGAVLLTVAVAGLACAAVGFLTPRLDKLRLTERTARRTALVAGTVVVLVAGLGAATQGADLWDRFSQKENASASDPTSRLTMINNGSRVEQWRLAWDTWKDHPWQGTGAGTFELTYNRSGPDSQFVRDAHSAFLESLSEQGVVGLAALLGFVLAIGALAIGAARGAASASDRGLAAGASASVAAFILGTAADWFWEVTALALVAMTLVGALVAAASEPVLDGEDRVPRTATAAGVPLRIGLALTAALAILSLLPGLVGTSEVRRSQRAVEAGDLARAREHADRAIDTIPWASSPFLQRGLVDERAGAWGAANASLRLAIRRDPYDWRLPLVLSRIEAKSGDAEAAIAAYRDAKALRPRGQFFR